MDRWTANEDYEQEAEEYEETRVLLTCRECGAHWEYESVEPVGCKALALVACPKCSAHTLLTV